MARYSDNVAPNAGAVAVSPAGDISATTVQAAIEELDTEKLATGGQALPVTDHGTKTTGSYTPNPSDGFLQKAVNDGAHTLAATAETGAFRLVYGNGSSAGAITLSGFDEVIDDDTALDHTVENSVIEIIIVNDGVAKVATVTLLTDATP